MMYCRFWAWMFAGCILGAAVWAPAQVVINEVAYDPEGDLSGDGTVSETGDEFIELYNAGGASVDLGGWDVGDTNSGRLTFPGGTTLEPGQFLTVFRDDEPNLTGQVFGGASFQLSNSGERVELRNAQDEVVDWTDDGGVTTNEAWEREPDGTGTFLRASQSSNNPETRFTPGAANLRAFQPPERLTVHFLDVGQGDSTLIVSPSGTTVLIDGGDNGMGTAVIVPYLRSLGIDGLTKTLDYMIATHFDSDHIGGLDEVAAAIPPFMAYDRGGNKETLTSTFTSYVDSIASVRQPIALGQTLDLGGEITLQALSKGEDLASAGDRVENLIYPAGRVWVGSSAENELAICLKLSWGGFQLSVAGDLTGGGLNSDDVEGDLATALGDIDVYQVNHHASLTSSSERFLRTIQPEVAVISVGTNEYGHPTQTIIDRIQSVAGAQVYQTETGSGGLGDFIAGGTIVLRTDGWTYSLEGGLLQTKTYAVDDATRESGILPGQVVINELRVDGRGLDEYIELRGAPGLSLLGCSLWGIDASGESPVETKLTSLDGRTIPANGYFVIGNDSVPNADLFDPGEIPWNAEPAAIELRFGSLPIDRVGSGPGGGGVYYEGSGPAPALPGTGDSIGRDSESADTNDNAADFRVQSPSPGVRNPEQADYSGLLMTEVCTKPTSDEFVELSNRGGSSIPLGGVVITDEETSNSEGTLRFPEGTTLASGETLVILFRATAADPPSAAFQNSLRAGTRLFGLDTTIPGYAIHPMELYPSAEGGTGNAPVLNDSGDNLAIFEPPITFSSGSGLSDANLCIDGMNYGNMTDPYRVPAGPGRADAGNAPTHAAGQSLQRTTAQDRDDSSVDFSAASMTPGSLPFASSGGYWRTY